MMTKKQAAREDALRRMKAAAMAYHRARLGGGSSGKAVTSALEAMNDFALCEVDVQKTVTRRLARQASR
jgi:hypothetical protein